MKLTALEKLGLKGIMESDYNGAAWGTSLPVWSWSVATLTPEQRPGVLSSLAKKGLSVSRGIADEREVELTPLGEKVYKELFPRESDYALLAAAIMTPGPKPLTSERQLDTDAEALHDILHSMLSTEEGAARATEVLNEFPMQLILRTKTVKLLTYTVDD